MRQTFASFESLLDDQFAPRQLACADCRTSFEFTVVEQRYFASRGYPAPIRCPACRERRRREREPRVIRNDG